jgi:flagellar M-ring protein FliF
MQRTQQTTGTQPVAAGVPGTASNAPNSQALPVYPKQTTSPETASSESGTYGVSKTVRHVVQDPGHVRRMTAAIVVNDHLIRAASKGTAAQWQPWPADQLRNLTALAQAAVGFDTTRGDVLTVADLAFDDNRAQPPASMPKQVLSTVEGSPLLVKYAALMLGLLLVLSFGVRPVLKSLRSVDVSRAKSPGKGAVKELTGHAAAPPALNPPEPAPLDPERIHSQEIFEQVSGHLKREPTQSSRLLQSWIHSD